MFTIICLSNYEKDKSGFLTEKEAIDYLCQNYICDNCFRDLMNRFTVFEDKKFPINSVFDTDCGAEYVILTDEEYNMIQNNSDIFNFAGFKKIENSDKLC